ncbi:ATP-binding protein [Nonomuraea sp. NPDC049309]|uniref:ATP-binding protein n=1 Tax=Nonomuraea sp. NPDC049309 TaxID=3364350 RepID=UPI00372295AB
MPADMRDGAGDVSAPDGLSLGALIRTWRDRALLTQEELAGKTGVSVRTIRRLEGEPGYRPRSRSLRLLAEALRLGPLEQALFAAAAKAAGSGRRTRKDAAAGTVSGPDAAAGTGKGPDLSAGTVAGSGEGDSASTWPAPRQLPRAVPGFVARAEELAELDTLLGPRAGDGGSRVCVVSGMAGVGKTCLALHWGHRARAWFPDGQLYVNLRGFGPAGGAVDPRDALAEFLEALGVPPRRIPGDLPARAALYRTILADKRVLIVLDNAREADQVKPLLPAAPSCAVLVTSRNALTGLVATEAAAALPLGLLGPDEARELLAARLGAARVAAERAAADAIVARCAGLPLALGIAAAHAAAHAATLASVAARLADRRRRLDTLDAGDPAADARAVFSWSYRALGAETARLFRLLALHPGPDFTIPAMASLAGLTPERSRPLAGELRDAHLLTEHLPGRYTMHDLLRGYAAELVRPHAGERRAALRRLLDHHLHTGHAAARLINPHREPITLAPCQAGVTVTPLAGYEEAFAWYAAEHRVLLGLISRAAAEGFDAHATQLVWVVTDFLYRQGHWDEWRATQRAGLAAAERLGDVRAQAIAHRGIAMACSNLGRHDEARPHIRRALDLYDRLGDTVGQAHTHLNLCALLYRQGRHREALHHGGRALDLYVAAGDLSGQAMAYNTTGFVCAELGDYEQALRHCGRAAALYERLDDPSNQAQTWDSIAHAHHRAGRLADAAEYFLRAIALFEKLDCRPFLARALVNLGEVHVAAGAPDAARAVWRRALGLLAEPDRPQADAVRAKLAALP